MLQWGNHRTTGEIAVSGRKVAAAAERQDMSLSGFERRKRFDYSLDLLRAVGLSPAAVDHYRRLARRTRTLPHELVCAAAERATQDGILVAIVMSGSGPA